MDEAEVADAPEAIKYGPRAVNKVYQYTLAVSPFDCMGCGVCVGVCPTNSLKMVPRESQDDQQAVFDYCVAKVTEKPETTAKINVISSQYKQPLLEFSGSCAGCAETSYARLITQLFGDRMYISTRPVAPPSGAVPPLPLPTPSTRTATVPPGRTPCSRTTPSTA